MNVVTSRLYVTVLNERLRITSTSELNQKLGTAYQGPAGTGKTESTKDLDKALGRYWVVFN